MPPEICRLNLHRVTLDLYAALTFTMLFRRRRRIHCLTLYVTHTHNNSINAFPSPRRWNFLSPIFSLIHALTNSLHLSRCRYVSLASCFITRASGSVVLARTFSFAFVPLFVSPFSISRASANGAATVRRERGIPGATVEPQLPCIGWKSRIESFPGRVTVNHSPVRCANAWADSTGGAAAPSPVHMPLEIAGAGGGGRRDIVPGRNRT